MTNKERMGQYKGRVPVTRSPRKSGNQLASVFSRNPHGEYSALSWIVDFTIPTSEIRTKDKLHASFFLVRNKSIYSRTGFCFTGKLTSEPVAELQQKTQSTGLWDKSFGRITGRYLLSRDFTLSAMDFLVSRCKGKQINQLVSQTFSF